MRGILIDVTYKTKGNKPVISLVFKGKRFFRIYDSNFEPYFYLDADEIDSTKKTIEQLVVEEKNETIKPKRVEKVRKILLGKEKELLKIICNHPRHVPVIREEVKKLGTTYEHNIPFTRRYIIDKGLTPLTTIKFEREGKELKRITKTQETPLKFNTLAFDIETYNPQGAPRPTKDPILMISYANSSSGVFTTKRINKPFITHCKDEKEMIEKFCQLVKETNTEILIGYNSSQFDLPYLKERAAVLKTQLSLGRDGSSFRLHRRGLITKAKITGRVHIDLFHIIRFLATIGALKTFQFTLSEVYSELTGKTKKSIPKIEIWKYWDDEKKCGELAEYSLNDAVAVKELAEQLLPMEFEISKLSKVPLFDICGSSTGTIVEQLLINRAHWENIIVPNQPKEEEIAARAASPAVGAFVKMPEPGIYENLAVFDFRSLYPSIIISHNVDPFTLNCSCCGKDSYLSPVGHRFCKKKKGLIPKVLEELLQKRAEIKKKMKSMKPGTEEYIQLDAQQQALKITANSFYGYLLYPRSRWYSKEAGESTTAWGRHYIQETMRKAEEAGFKVLYGDTDSLMLLLGEKTKKDALEFVKKINNELPEKMELELEGFYSRGVFVSKKSEAKGAKKKYALIGEDGRIKIRGFELVRRDWAGVAKKVQQQVLEAILKEGSKEKALKIVRDKINELREGRTPLDELVIYTQLKKSIGKYEVTSPELEAAKKALSAGIHVEEGSLVGYVITKKGASISEKAVPAELAKDYDAVYYIEHQVIPAVLKILRELGVKKEDLVFGGKQSVLGDWHG
ncbi:MAG: DNA-directed DNA polymerase [Candidatus Micrarchaeia archaeon]